MKKLTLEQYAEIVIQLAAARDRQAIQDVAEALTMGLDAEVSDRRAFLDLAMSLMGVNLNETGL